MNDDDALFHRLLAALDEARDAAKDVLGAHRKCGCAFCREVTGVECALELFGNTLRCRNTVEAEEAAEAIEAA